jgi:hypothetical protein
LRKGSVRLAHDRSSGWHEARPDRYTSWCFAPCGCSNSTWGFGVLVNQHLWQGCKNHHTFLGAAAAPAGLGTFDGYGKIAIRSLRHQHSVSTRRDQTHPPDCRPFISSKSANSLFVSHGSTRPTRNSHIQRPSVLSQITHFLQQTPDFSRQRLGEIVQAANQLHSDF